MAWPEAEGWTELGSGILECVCDLCESADQYVAWQVCAWNQSRNVPTVVTRGTLFYSALVLSVITAGDARPPVPLVLWYHDQGLCGVRGRTGPPSEAFDACI